LAGRVVEGSSKPIGDYLPHRVSALVCDESVEADSAALGKLGKKGGTSGGRSDVRTGPGPNSRQSADMRSIARALRSGAAEVDSM